MLDSRYIAAIVFLLCVSGFLRLISATTTPCDLRSTTFGNVCVCNVTYCDFLEPAIPKGPDDFLLTSSSKMGLRFSRQEGKFSDENIKVKDWMEKDILPPNATISSEKTSQEIPTIRIDRSKKYQKIVGFGGAFTSSVAYNLESLTQELQDSVFKSYFSKKGLAYTMMRMPIGGCDFDLQPWAYNEHPENDTKLSNFNKLTKLDDKKIKLIKRLKHVAKLKNIKIMATAWSPPKWMKTLPEWFGFSFVQEKYYQTWADYHLKFVELMEASDVPIWAITTGNEPLNGVYYTESVRFMSLGWTPVGQANWIADNLGPTVRNSKFKNVKIFGSDDHVFNFPVWFKTMNDTRHESMDYLDGLAVHWYFDKYYSRDLIDETHKLYPDKIIMNTESSIISKPTLGSWERGEQYADSYMDDLQHEVNGYIDWNMVLNEEGGPTYVDNFLESPIIANVTSGQEIYKQPMFYAIGHFTRFIPEDSIRIGTERSNTEIDSVAFERPDGSITSVFINRAQTSAVFNLVDSMRGNIEITIPPKSWHTIEYN